MTTFSERFCEALSIRNITAAELSRKLNINEGTISQYKKGLYEPKQRRLQAIAEVLNVSIPWLMGADVPMDCRTDNIIPIDKVKKIPILGRIACGDPILAEENIEGYILEIKGVKSDFALVCKGDSMINARINDGDIVYIKEQPSVENGQIGAVLIDGEATLKRVYYYPEKETLILKAENTKYDDFIFTGSELENVKIIGKAVGFYSSII